MILNCIRPGDRVVCLEEYTRGIKKGDKLVVCEDGQHMQKLSTKTGKPMKRKIWGGGNIDERYMLLENAPLGTLIESEINLIERG